MPGATPRNYPFPLGPEPIDVAGDIEKLARAIDTDTGGLSTRVTNVENVNNTQAGQITQLYDLHNGQVGQISDLYARDAAQAAQINQLYSRTQWLRENNNDTARYSGLWYGSTDGNGEFWVIVPFGLQISSNASLVMVADINIGAWCVFVDGTANTIHGRLFSTSGIVPNLALMFSYQIAGVRASAFP